MKLLLRNKVRTDSDSQSCCNPHIPLCTVTTFTMQHMTLMKMASTGETKAFTELSKCLAMTRERIGSMTPPLALCLAAALKDAVSRLQ